QTFDANYPPALLMEGISSGEVWVMITVDETGKLTDILVTRYTHPGFVREAVRGLRSWEYVPARLNGTPISVRTEVRLFFESTGQVITLDPGSALRQLTAYAHQPRLINQLCTPAELDAMPTLLKKISPPHPGRRPGAASTSGRATLDFIIDEQGQPRMPVVISASDDEYANAAAVALSQWKFTPPSRQGKPVAVHVRQEFVFSADTQGDHPVGPTPRRLSALRD
ncbi:MAG TPA: TonB family protein, partial [Opitutus sp.]|nr:TonB family protein [Opitutus sp.]